MTDFVLTFLRKNLGGIIYSTSATKTNVTDDVFNVVDSTDDPEIDGKSWKELLIANGIDGPCYVTNESPDDKSHPQFDVGGHMTLDSTGIVENGASCLLMPLCKYHNHYSRTEAFKHDRTEMLELSGFMEKDTLATFMWRSFKQQEVYRALVKSSDDWEIVTQGVGGADIMDSIAMKQGVSSTNSIYAVLEKDLSNPSLLKQVTISDGLKSRL